MRLIFSLVILSLCTMACSNRSNETENVIVKVNDETLTKDELEVGIPSGLTSEDSTIAAEHFIHQWINNILMYEMATKNIADKKYIEQLINNYRQSLVIYQYKEQLISEKLSKEIDNQSLLDYYNANMDKFKIDRPLVKGLFLKIPHSSSQIDKIKIWYKSLVPANITNIENYCVRNAVEYGYFIDNWVDFNELTSTWPDNFRNQSDAVKLNKYIEQKDSKYYYLLNVTDYLLPGDNAPFEYAKPTIREMLINQQKIDFLKNIEEDLYRKALDKGNITFYKD